MINEITIQECQALLTNYEKFEIIMNLIGTGRLYSYLVARFKNNLLFVSNNRNERESGPYNVI